MPPTAPSWMTAAALNTSSRLSMKPTTVVSPRVARVTASSALRFASMKADLKTRSSGGYPGTASSGKATRPAPSARALSMPSTIRRTLPSKSPTVGLIWARAILSRLMGAVTWLDCIMQRNASEDPLAAVSSPARGANRALPALRPDRHDPVDAQTRRSHEAGLPYVGLHRVPGDRGAARTRLIPLFCHDAGRFVTTIPRLRRKAPTPKSSRPGTPLELPFHAGRISGRRTIIILVVDDDGKVREVVAGMLSALGHTVLQAPDALAAITTLEGKGSIDLVLTDLVMPGLNGWDLVKTVKRRWPLIRVAIVTGNQDMAAQASQAVEFVIKKPFGLDTLERVLGRAGRE